jgi:hypothetical protein
MTTRNLVRANSQAWREAPLCKRVPSGSPCLFMSSAATILIAQRGRTIQKMRKCRYFNKRLAGMALAISWSLPPMSVMNL